MRSGAAACCLTCKRSCCCLSGCRHWHPACLRTGCTASLAGTCCGLLRRRGWGTHAVASLPVCLAGLQLYCYRQRMYVTVYM